MIVLVIAAAAMVWWIVSRRRSRGFGVDVADLFEAVEVSGRAGRATSARLPALALAGTSERCLPRALPLPLPSELTRSAGQLYETRVNPCRCSGNRSVAFAHLTI